MGDLNELSTPLDLLESRIADRGELPVFRKSVREVLRLGEDTQCAASDIARVILKDQGFAIKVNRVANSQYYNRSDRAIKTISRAVVILGIETIRDICLGLGLIEMFLKHNPQINLKAILARSYFAANLAQEFAEHVPDVSREEAFLASLLQYLGPIAVAYYLPEKYLQIRQLALQSSDAELPADIQILGFRFEDFSSALAEKWSLPQYLVQSLNDQKAISESTSISRLSKIAFNISQSLFSDETTDEDIETGVATLGKVFNIDEAEVGNLVERSFSKTKNSSELFGVEARALQPLVGSDKTGSVRSSLARRLWRIDSEFEKVVTEPKPASEEIPKDKYVLQVDLLHEITLHILEKRDLNTLFNLILEGVQKVIGFDRIILALCNPERTEIRGRFGLGLNTETLIANFRIPMHESNLIGRCLIVRKAEFVADSKKRAIQPLLPASIQQILMARAFVVSPIYSTDKEVGLIYADILISGREISPNDFQRFDLFALQANLGIDRIFVHS